MWIDIAIKTILAAFVLFNVMNFAALHGWIERKQSALIQDRIGANRASIFGIRLFGLFHPIADAIKLFTKEDFSPADADKLLHTLAPFLSVLFALVGFAAIPFGDLLRIGGREISLQAAHLNAGLLFILAFMSMTIYGVVLAGLSSRSNYAYLGGVRAASQMLAYEISLGLSLIGLVMIYGTLDLQEMVRRQGELWHGIPQWGILLQPLAFFIFMTAGLAETKRVPFDCPEGESEIIGYFVEYSGMKFGMFLMADFIETILIASLTTTFFLGGWQLPYLYADGFHFPWGAEPVPLPHLGVAFLQIGSFMLKVIALAWLFMTVRWTLPRFRYDQLLKLGWKILFPLALANVVATGGIMILVHSR